MEIHHSLWLPFQQTTKTQEAVISLVLGFFKVNGIHVLLSNKVFLKVYIICPPESTLLGTGLLWKCKSCSLRAQKGLKALRA